ncbi:adhesin [Actinoplanes sp. LDG1-06]|uniref:Adhesin n=1 Tax=Paractinoplanes ovalisporus TaxID=2810368 RepID=A0ABS2ABP1_9ACTN|nr:adhesin [Actinoplanes ovalisporus]MBM2617223.1 adhesin [Actinoplanes ovalisporus]
MRSTVGPLPSAVYWRRRAVVLGALLLGIIVLFVSCSGGDDKNGNKQGQTPTSNSSQLPTPEPASPEPSFLDGRPGNNGPSLPAPGDLQSQPAGDGEGDATETLPPTGGADPGSGQNNNVTAPADGSCADGELSVTPVPASTNLKRGQSVQIELKIKNNSQRTCSRDVGADPQELYIDSGARKYWSSDTCSTAKGGDVRQLPPGQELTYKVTWNGRQSSNCTGGSASGPNPPPGQFELRARLGTLVSNPVTLTITA